MSRVTEFPDDEEPLRDEPSRAPGRDEEESERAIRLPKLSIVGRIGEFYQTVKQEMRKTTWPDRSQVWSTTLVVLLAIVFFGFYLWGVDRLVTLGFEALEKAIR
jgi:preprotein translocase subunit SecE